MTEPPRGPNAPTPWQFATVNDIHVETPTAKSFTLRLEQPMPYFAGQSVVVRLTAPDGYQASRSYSIASAPGDPRQIAISVERLAEGEVSTFLHDELRVSDEVEVRGPIGGWFVWRGDTPALLIGGGSGVVPLMAMLRLARGLEDAPPVRLIVSVREPEDLYYAGELPGPEATVIYTRKSPPESGRPTGRMTSLDLQPLVLPGARVFICGSSGFADAATVLATGCGVATDDIRIERFGPTG